GEPAPFDLCGVLWLDNPRDHRLLDPRVRADQIPFPAADLSGGEDVHARVTLDLRARFIACHARDRAGMRGNQYPRHRVIQLAIQVHAGELARARGRELAAGHPLAIVNLDPVAMNAVDRDVVKPLVDAANWLAVRAVVDG